MWQGAEISVVGDLEKSEASDYIPQQQSGLRAK
jgi:hypothetical protein